MASKPSTVKKSSTDTAKKIGTGAPKERGINTPKERGTGKPRVSAQQKKMRTQQIGMAIFAIILVVAMILATVIR